MATNKQELSSEDLALVLRELFTVQDKWYNIGLCLRLLPVTLTGIKHEDPKEENCLRAMLNQRINQGGLTWEKIAEALEDVTVGRKVEARKIREKYCTPVATQTVLTTTRVSLGHPALIPQQGVFNSNAPVVTTTRVAPVVTTTRVAPRHPALISFNSNARPVIHQPPVLRTNLVNPTAGPSNYPSNSAVPTPVPPKKTTTTKRPPDRPIAGPSKCTLMAKKRPANSPLIPSSKRPRKAAEYYNEDMFVCRSSLKKYQCIHCKKTPKSFFRCKCGKEDEKQETGKGRAKFDGNTGLSCSDCTHKACTKCEQSDQYEPDKATSDNIRKLKVFCENKCGENITLINLENKSHVRNKCSARKRTCKYVWAGCKNKGAGDEIEQHEKKLDVHVLAAIDELHEEILKLRKDNSDLRKDNSDLNKRINMIEAKTNPGSSGPQTTRQL